MAATKQDIIGWFRRGVAEGATHMIVVCDTYDHDDYPVYVSEEQDVREEEKRMASASMQVVMEVYSLRKDMDMQMSERRAFHYD